MIRNLNVAQGIAILLTTNKLNGEPFYIGDDAPITQYKLIDSFIPAENAFDPEEGPLYNAFESIMDISKLRSKSGFRPLFPS